jgi:hypothetical protein
VWYVISTDQGDSWSDAQLLASIPPDRTLLDFDGIIAGRGDRLLASFAVQEGTTAKVEVKFSKDGGNTWSNWITAGQFEDSILTDCPTLTAEYQRKLGGFVLYTTVGDDGVENAIYVMKSKNGRTWDVIGPVGPSDLPDCG